MLTESDYLSLKRSCKGWTARRLARYGVKWPPQQGWRRVLLREYECAHKGRMAGPFRATPAPKNRDEELVELLDREKRITAQWYLKMSGEVGWEPGEREVFSRTFQSLSHEIRRVEGKMMASWFASLPDDQIPLIPR